MLCWFNEHTAPPEQLGPYQALHRLKSLSATLRVQLRDSQQRILWEGQIETPLSPENDRAAFLDQAVQNLMNELPRSGS
ncbi:hypothetical protein WG219_02725 [Ectopseudomonas mendocina]|uniref:Uncharacterized protein n=1 Tax=Ectopseudomonas mendocina TaxID=300 RepID=A0ABZ2RLE2_ECTME